MSYFGAVPFTLKRSSDLWEGTSFRTTTETAHGLLRLEGGQLVVQWRVAVKTESMSAVSMETKEEIEPVREIVIPLREVAGASVQQPWWRLLAGPKLVLTASDLIAFERIAGPSGLRLKHPAKLELRIKRSDRLIAEEFAAELALAVAQLPRGADAERALPSPGPVDPGGPRHHPAPGREDAAPD